MTLLPFAKGRCLVWDATVICTLAATYVDSAAGEVGAAGRIAERRKHNIYKDFESEYDVVPVAFETHGPLGADTDEFLLELSRRIKKERGGAAGYYFLQRLSLCIQRGNAIAMMATMGFSPEFTETE